MGSATSMLELEIINQLGPINLADIFFSGKIFCSSKEIRMFEDFARRLLVYVQREDMYVLLMLTTLLSNMSIGQVQKLHRLCLTLLLKKFVEYPEFKLDDPVEAYAKLQDDLLIFKNLMRNVLSICKIRSM